MVQGEFRTDRKQNVALAACAVFMLADLAFARGSPFEAVLATAAFLPCSLLFICVAAYRFAVVGGVGATLAVACLVAAFGEHAEPALVAMQAIVGASIGHLRASAMLRDRCFRALTKSATELVLVLDRNATASYASPSFATLLGCEPAALMGSGYRKIFDARSIGLLESAVENAKAGTAVSQRFELEAAHSDGSIHALDVTATNSLGDPAVRGVILNARDISERRFVEAQLAQQATHDALTGLPNRSMLHAKIEEGLTHVSREANRLALLVVDLDRFKDINDALGHQAGDALLREVGRRLQGQIRGTDFVARLGGDQFGVVVVGADVDDAALVAERLVAALARPFEIRSQTITVAASVGIALTGHDSTVTTLLRQADVAMYSAKRRRSGIAIFTRNEDHRALDRLVMASALPSAIANDELVLHYQPQIHLATGAIKGVEALVRWQHPERGLLSPEMFLPLAEEIGMMDRVTDWVLRTAIRQLKRWNRNGRTLRVAVNLSAQDLRDARLGETISRLVSLYGIDPAQLCLELTETIMTTDAERAAGTLRELSRSGIRISIDDFGTGYSSLAHIKQFPANELKIDKQFVIGMAGDRDDAAIVSSTIELAHRLGLDVVVEGVENDAAYAATARLGAELAQGFGISRPMTADEFDAWREEYDTRRLGNAATA